MYKTLSHNYIKADAYVVLCIIEVPNDTVPPTPMVRAFNNAKYNIRVSPKVLVRQSFIHLRYSDVDRYCVSLKIVKFLIVGSSVVVVKGVTHVFN